MADFVTFRQSQTGEVKAVKIGFSWTLFFFSTCFGAPFWIRKAYKLGLSCLGYNLFCAVNHDAKSMLFNAALGLAMSVALGLFGNKLTAQYYLKNGWEFADPESETAETARQKWQLA